MTSGPLVRTPLSTAILQRLDQALAAAADPVRAVAAAKYMRGQFPFLGIASPLLTRLGRAAQEGLAAPAPADLVAVARTCWERPEREYQYFACQYLRRWVKVGDAGLLMTVRELVTTKSWWDTVDTLAAHTVGPLVLAHPAAVATLDAWVRDENLWLVRTAILHQLTFQQRTDVPRLFDYCTAQAGHRDFFVRKAIGWALRQYSRTDPAAVRSYVAAHRDELAALSVREAGRHL